MKPITLILFIFFVGAYSQDLFAQHKYFNRPLTEADSLRGYLSAARACYDVTFYKLDISVFPKSKSIKGTVEIDFTAVSDFKSLQLDLYRNMLINEIVFFNVANFKTENIPFTRKHDAVLLEFPSKITKGSKGKIRVAYEGEPRVAKNAPWDGGFVWTKDAEGTDWIGVACEGDGASLWWPNKDHLSDEPDSMVIRATVPKGLMCISNGNLTQTEQIGKDQTAFTWKVTYPINNYNVSLNIGNYAHFEDEYFSFDKEKLALDYYVLSYNLEKAKKHFKQVNGVLACYEKYFDKYPFWKDGYALIETPYLGMEHQSGIAYGNKYMRGYLGGMVPKQFDFDYIIVHETGHEYWGNSISCKDHAEMWIHEAFTTYMEALYVEHTWGYESAVVYLMSQRPFIHNREPIVGILDVNWQYWQASDMYYKGSWMLHTLRNAINDNKLWFDILKSFYQQHKISHITTQDFITFVNQKTGKDYTPIFEQFLYHPNIPVLEYKLKKRGKSLDVTYRWKADVAKFNLPMEFGQSGNYKRVYPSQQWQKLRIKNITKEEFSLAEQFFYVEGKLLE